MNNDNKSFTDASSEKSDNKLDIQFWILPFGLVFINLYLLIMVVPKFKRMFDELRAELPYISQLLLYFSNIIFNNLIFIVILIGLAALVIWRYKIRVTLMPFIAINALFVITIIMIPISIFYPVYQLQKAVENQENIEQ